MRRALPLLLAVAALAACGGDDTTSSSDPASGTTDTGGTTDSTAAADGAGAESGDGSDNTLAPPITVPRSVPESRGDCEDAPDPADYVDGQVPPAVRPCTLPTELVVHTLRAGTGPAAAPGDTLIADYIGIRSEDGKQFDTSYTRGVPIDFPIGRGGVIRGWDEGLLGATAGSAFKLDIPADLAYGDSPPGGGDIRAGDALTFIVEVRAVVPSVTVEDSPFEYDLEPSIGAVEVTITDLVAGDGATVAAGQTAVIHVLLIRGDNEALLYNSWELDEPIQVVVQEGQTLPGILQSIEGARVGSLRAIAMPPADAFGEEGEPILGLPAGVDLIAVVEILGVF